MMMIIIITIISFPRVANDTYILYLTPRCPLLYIQFNTIFKKIIQISSINWHTHTYHTIMYCKLNIISLNWWCTAFSIPRNMYENAIIYKRIHWICAKETRRPFVAHLVILLAIKTIDSEQNEFYDCFIEFYTRIIYLNRESESEKERGRRRQKAKKRDSKSIWWVCCVYFFNNLMFSLSLFTLFLRSCALTLIRVE